MKTHTSLVVILQVAVSLVRALPFSPATDVETRENHHHVPFFEYPAVSEEAGNVRRSPFKHIPFVHYPGSIDQDEGINNAKEERRSAVCRRNAPAHCKPFVHYPDEAEVKIEHDTSNVDADHYGGEN
ncbi:hypothetical protein C8R46DRAFT_1341895 [Mycena filopes]|nr:hypothetical protein C8R46DRAFT_1341895 [Mycena filopes]